MQYLGHTYPKKALFIWNSYLTGTSVFLFAISGNLETRAIDWLFTTTIIVSLENPRGPI